MKVISGTYNGNLVLSEDTEIRGTVLGNVDVPAVRTLGLNGTINGNLSVRVGGTGRVRGTVNGTLRNYGAVVEIWGVVDELHDLDPTRASIVYSNAVINRRV